MANNILVTYGSFTFDSINQPNPGVSISRNGERTPGNNDALFTPLEVTLEGNIITSGFQPVVSGIQAIENAFSPELGCQAFKIQCDSNTPLIDSSGVVTSISFQPRNDGDLFAQNGAYTITLEIPSLSGDAPIASGITALSEEWSIQHLDEKAGGTAFGGSLMDTAFTVSHNVSITVADACTTDDGLTKAESYLNTLYGSSTPSDANVTSVFDISSIASINYYNHYRVINKSVQDGSISMSETWVASTGAALEDFEVSREKNLDSDQVTVTANGTIQGLASISYPAGTGSTSKMQNAITHWTGVVSGSLYSRASALYDGDYSLNPTGFSSSIGYNGGAGTVSYNFVYNDRPANCVANAKSEIININETEPNDIFASLTVLGRLSGPLFQEVGTSGARTREISIEAILPRSGACNFADFTAPGDYDSLVNTYEAGLISAYDQVFINNDTKTWSPKDGRFTWTKGWTVGNCS
jgi:hypothetical protein